MRFILLFIFINFTTILIAQDGWVRFTDLEGNFRINVPQELSKHKQTITTDIGDLTYHRFYYHSAEKNANNYVFMVNYVDYPEGTLHSDSLDLVQALFEETRQGAAENIEGNIRYHDPILMYDYPGELWRIDYNGNTAVMKTKVYVVKNRFYLLQVATTRPKRMDASINQFLDSFQLLAIE